MYWRPLERDGFAAAETEPADDAMTAGASCFETALEMEWPALLERRDAVRESMVGLISCQLGCSGDYYFIGCCDGCRKQEWIAARLDTKKCASLKSFNVTTPKFGRGF